MKWFHMASAQWKEKFAEYKYKKSNGKVVDKSTAVSPPTWSGYKIWALSH